MVGYVGGSNYDGTFSFGDWERLCHYDALVVGFANFWSSQPGCNGPTEPGLGVLPQLNTNACIQKGPAWLGKPSRWQGCTLVECGGCGTGTVGDRVLEYQRKGYAARAQLNPAIACAAELTLSLR